MLHTINPLFKILASILFLVSCSSPKSNKIFSETINTLIEPKQIKINNKQIKSDFYDGYGWTITAISKYEISAIIRGKENYYFGWKSHFSPIDLCLSWGKLNTSEIEKYITYSQSNRWYYFKYKNQCTVNKNYISQHSSNNHIIPNNKNILKAIKSTEINNKIKLNGYLVKIYGMKEKNRYWWNSSLTRNDTGNGSCEVFYVTEVTYNNKIFK